MTYAIDYEENRAVFALELMQSDIDALPDGVVSAEEALAILSPLFDVFGRLFYNAKVALTKGFSGFRRSELRAYHESHKHSLKPLLNNAALFIDYKVASPRGMTATYHETATVITDLFAKVDIKDTVKDSLVFLMTLNNIDTKTLKDKVDAISKLATHINKVTRASVESELGRVFKTSNQLEDVSGTKVFGSSIGVTKAFEAILGFEHHYDQAQKMLKETDRIDAQLAEIITVLRSAGDVDTRFLKAMHSFVYNLAVQIDMYGALLAVCQNVEHAFVHALHRVRTSQ